MKYYNPTTERRRKTGGPVRAKLLLGAAFIFLGLIVISIISTVGLLAYVARDLPSPDKVVRREGFSTKIFDRNEKLLYDVYADQRRTLIDLNQVPLYLRQATVAVEDKSFYKHAGFDPLTPFRIVWNMITKQRVIGGSTLTQQLVKNTLLSSERTIKRKVKEFVLTLQVEAKYTKDEILQMYLNEAPYGGTAWGVEAGSEAIFGKPVNELNLPESAILAGLPQNPTSYSPFVGDLYINRAKDVLRRMKEDGYIDSNQEMEASNQLKDVQISNQSGTLKAPHFVFYIKERLAELYGEKALEQGGLRVTTTLDLDLQEAAEKVVAEEIAKVKHLKISNGAAMVVDTTNGQILAMVGSRGWSDPDIQGKFNVATALRQPGSTIKPVTYLTGLKKGYTAATMLMDVKTDFPGGDKPSYTPENYDGKYRGPISVRESLANSLNVPAVKMVSLTGINDMLQTAYDMGFSSLEPTPDLLKRVGLSVTLGGGEVRLIDMVSAYSAFANTGKKVEPISILKITDNSGKVLEEWQEKPTPQVIAPEEAFIISSILSDPQARMITFGAATSLTVPGKTVAVKTGTTNDRRDNWTVGWSPNGKITGVWVGNNDNSPMLQVASGITGASPIWKRIMIEALKNAPNDKFATPSGIVELDVDKYSGYAAHDGYPSRKEYFIKGTEPTEPDPIHKKIKVCKGEGKLATLGDIGSNNYEEKEAWYFKEEDPFQSRPDWKKNAWQEGILNWLKDQADPKYNPPTEFCGSSNSVWITILEPTDRSRINGDDVTVKVRVDDPNKITNVEFYLDGALKYSLISEPWEITIPNLSNGKHKVEVKARNEKGQEGTRLLDFAINEDY